MTRIKIYEPATDESLTRTDTRRMRLPFEQGWAYWIVVVGDEVEAVYDNYAAARDHATEPIPIAA